MPYVPYIAKQPHIIEKNDGAIYDNIMICHFSFTTKPTNKKCIM